MVARQWSPRLAPVLLFAILTALGGVASVPRGAGAIPRRLAAFTPIPSTPPPLPVVPALADLHPCVAAIGALRTVARPTADTADSGAWYRLDPRLDGPGSLIGQALTVGQADSATMLALPAESAASGPEGAAVLVVSDDGSRSSIHVVDARQGCATLVATTDDIVRRAMFVPGDDAIVEHRLDRATRQSLGIWRRPLDGGPASRILAPIQPDDRFERTFSTELAWSDDGRLVVQSCGAAACRVRVLDLATGRLELATDDDRQGELVGLAGRLLVTYESCPGLPCPIVATELSRGRRRVLASAAGFALLSSGPGGPRLVHEVAEPGSGSLRALSLADGAERRIEVGPGLLMAPSATRSSSSLATPPDWLLLSRDGRSHGPGRRVLINPSSGQQMELGVVTR